jgi:hypothetical protein
VELEEAKNIEDILKQQLSEKNARCEALEKEVVKNRKELEKFQTLYHPNLSNIKASEELATIINQQRNPKLKTGLGYEEGSSSDQPGNKEPIKFSNLASMTTKNLQKQKKIIIFPGGLMKEVPKLKLWIREIMYYLFKEIINIEEINLLKEDNHFPSTNIFSMDIVSFVLTLVIKL